MLHFFEITDRSFVAELADYLPKEAFKQSDYVLITLAGNNRTLLITSNNKLGELMDGMSIRKHCRRVTRKFVAELSPHQDAESLSKVVGNIELWRG